MFSRLLGAATALAVFFSASAQAQAVRAPTVTPERLLRHIEVLASDAYEGRKPGTAGESKTLLYIASQFAGIGLEPAAGKGSWYQPVPLVQRRPFAHRVSFSTPGRSWGIEKNDLILIGREPMEKLENAPVFFLGSAAAIPQENDLRGGIVLMLYPGASGTPSYAERSRAAIAAGAEAVIAVLDEDSSWGNFQSSYSAGADRLQSEPVPRLQGAMPYAAAAGLIEAAGASLAKLASSAEAPVRLSLRGTLEVSTEVRNYVSHNVIGRLRGSGATGESLLYLGHWDHLGICEPEGAADRICNGAVDNASGIAMMIEVAAELAHGKRPKRDILFMATTAEEMGLLGAERFAANPTVPAKSIVAALNLDTVAIQPRGAPVAVVGNGAPALDRLIAQTAAELGRMMDTDKEADEFVSRQDGWMLARAGIPSAMVGGSFSNMEWLSVFLSGPYHRPKDDLQRGLVLDGAAEDSDLMVALGRKLADPSLYPSPGAGARP